MPSPHAAKIVLTDDERVELEGWVRRRNSAAGLALRARIVLACADGGSNVEVAERLELDRGTIRKWRNRFAEKRCDPQLPIIDVTGASWKDSVGQADVGEVRDQQHVGGWHPELALDQIGGPRSGRIGDGGADLLAPGDPTPAVGSHQPLHRAAGHRVLTVSRDDDHGVCGRH